VLLVVVIVGGLWLVDRVQTDAQQRQQAKQYQQNLAAMTATTVAVATQDVYAQATFVAYAATQQAPIDAQATQSLATLAAYRASLDATVSAGQVNAQATNTALARQR
jgi:DNA integrity scanning protein DisA with diadenylate cyclase activity